MGIIERKLQEIGESLLVTLPKAWTKMAKLKRGSRVQLRTTPEGFLIVAPEISIPSMHTQCSLAYDALFARRFFREYFKGHEQITVIFQDPDVQQHQLVHAFLNRFMNVQVIEENARKMTVKCFKIQELSIIECLKRMHHLCVSMFEPSADHEQVDITIAKFYYLLIMQTRRYIDEGRFAEENQIPLIRALDVRMVAEKIERIADILKGTARDRDVAKAKAYYTRVFDAFLFEEYEKAIKLYNEGRSVVEYYSTRSAAAKTKEEYARFDGMRALNQWILEISMLVR